METGPTAGILALKGINTVGFKINWISVVSANNMNMGITCDKTSLEIAFVFKVRNRKNSPVKKY